MSSPEFTQSPGGALLSRCCGALMQGFGSVVQCVVCKQDAAVWNEDRGGWDPVTGGSTETADKQPADPAHSQSSGSGVHAAKFPAKDDQDAVSRPPVAPAPLPE